MEANDNPPAAPENWTAFLRFEGRGGEYFGILLRNFFFSLLTLGVYSFWGKVRARQYLWSRTHVLDEPLEYTGTGKELFISFLIVMPVVLICTAIFSALAQIMPPLLILLYPLVLFLWEFASYRALRYRLTRTRWRGIRGNMSGSAAHYAWKAALYWLAVFGTLGLLLPWASARMANLKLNNICFGSRKAAFDGPAKELIKTYLACYGLSLLLLAGFCAAVAAPAMMGGGYNGHGMPLPQSPEFVWLILAVYIGLVFCFSLVYSFYQAAYFRWLCGHFAFGGMRLRSLLRGGRVFFLVLTNTLLLLCTMGLAWAWVRVRSLRLTLNSVDCAGDPDLDGLLQDTLNVPSRGEGLLEALDVDIAL